MVAAPSPPYVGPARNHGAANNKPIHRIVIHGTVSKCERGQARIVARMFNTTSRPASAHYVVDPGEVVQDVYDSVVAYAAPPNQHTIHVELCDFQSTDPKTAGRWKDANHVAMLALAHKLVAQLALAYGVPITRLSVADLKVGKHGICGHVDVSNAWHQTTHTDPGPFFPWVSFMAGVRAEADKLKAPAPPKPKPPVITLPTGPIPQSHPKTLHLLPYWWNNSYGALLVGRLKGYHYADQDTHCDADGVFWGIHDGVASRNGYLWLATGDLKNGKEVRVKDPRPEVSIGKRSTDEVSRLRRYASGEDKGWRLTRATEHVKRCHRLGMRMCLEAKGTAGMAEPDNWVKFRGQLEKEGVKVLPYVMSLQSIPDWRDRLYAAKLAGFETALLPRGNKPADWPLPYIDALWSTSTDHW